MRLALILILLWQLTSRPISARHEVPREPNGGTYLSELTPNPPRKAADQVFQPPRSSSNLGRFEINPGLIPGDQEDHPGESFPGRDTPNSHRRENRRRNCAVQEAEINNHLLELLGKIRSEERRGMIVDEILAEINRRRNSIETLLREMRRGIQLPHPESTGSTRETKSIDLRVRSILLSRFDDLCSTETSFRKHRSTSRSQLRLLVEHYICASRTVGRVTSDLPEICSRTAPEILPHPNRAGDRPHRTLETNLLISLGRQMRLTENIHLRGVMVANDLHRVKKIFTHLQEQTRKSNVPGTSATGKSPILRDRRSQRSNPDRIARRLRSQHLTLRTLAEKVLEFTALIHDHPQMFTQEQTHHLSVCAVNQHNTASTLILGCDTQLIKFSRLSVLENSLRRGLKEIRKMIHHHRLRTADTEPMTCPLSAGDLRRFLRELWIPRTEARSADEHGSIINSCGLTILILDAVLMFNLPTGRDMCLRLLGENVIRVATIDRTNLLTTLRDAVLSSLTTTPLPVLWTAAGCVLISLRNHPVCPHLGRGMLETTLVAWICTASFQLLPSGQPSPCQPDRTRQITRSTNRYRISIICTTILAPVTLVLNRYRDGEFRPSLGRICLLLFCFLLALLFSGAGHATPNPCTTRRNKIDNLPDKFLRILSTSATCAAGAASWTGYLYTAELILTRLGMLVATALISSTLYHIAHVRTFVRYRHRLLKRGERMPADSPPHTMTENAQNRHSQFGREFDTIKLDRRDVQSLQLTRSFLIFSTLSIIVLLCPEIGMTFKLLENIVLWETRDGECIRLITLNSVFFTLLLIGFTTQVVRNAPILLERLLLDNVSLNPGTGYTIVNLTRYGIVLLSAAISCSALGVEWIKLQWLIAALGVGLGFGLQEIFTNFISGLIILFERPVRVGDTVTIGNLTGSVTKINTRATTITDWNHREIVVPNKAFITDQFVNWSLSDTVTRIVLSIPAPGGANTRQVATILVQSALRCSLVLRIPIPEALLVDLRGGLPIFELRMYAAEVRHRMPIRHQVCTLILEGYREYGMELPFPPIHIKNEQMSTRTGMTRGR